jgi:hypothetical protein
MAVVYVLGAGASKAILPPAPLMSELLPHALKVLKSDISKTKRTKRIMDFIEDFYRLGPCQLPLLEDILSQLDLAIKEGRPLSNEYDLPYLRQLREDLVYAFSVLLRENLGIKPQTGNMSDEGQRCMDLMEKFLGTLDASNDCIISLNYDLIVDNAISKRNGRHVNYGFSVRYDDKEDDEKPGMPRQLGELPLYKLHGSLNWLYCPVCQQLDVANNYRGVRYIFEACDNEVFNKCKDCTTKYEPVIC